MAEVSVIVPVYKVEKYLQRCIESILAQTFSDFELLLIDDGSPDGSGVICDEYAEKDSRVRVFHKTNGGVSSARNLGLNHARGKYIMFCDSDDYVAETWMESMVCLSEEHNLDLAICGFFIVSAETESVIGELPSKHAENSAINPLSDFYELIVNKTFNVPWNKIYKNTIIKENHILFDAAVSCGEDVVFNLQYIQCCKGYYGLSEKYLYFYMKDRSTSLSSIYHKEHSRAAERYDYELWKALEKHDVCFEEIEIEFYSHQITSIAAEIGKIVSFKNMLRFSQKRKECLRILRSSKCKEAFKKGEFREFHPLYVPILRARSFWLIWAFQSLIRVKYKLKRKA